MSRRLALLAGLTHVNPSAYDDWPGECPGADRDVSRMARLVDDRGFDGVSCFLNATADHQFILPTFLAAAHVLEADDLLLLYYSGHGGQRRDISGDESDGQDETFCWWNGEVIDDQIAAYLRLLKRCVRVLFISDCCHGDTDCRGPRQRVRPRKLTIPGFKGSLLRFNACASDRFAWGDGKGGAFTKSLLDALPASGDYPSERDWFERAAAALDPKVELPVMTVIGTPFLDREALT
jgi:hypothetical protein